MTYVLRPAIGNRTQQFVSRHFQGADTLREARSLAERITRIPVVEVSGWENQVHYLAHPAVSIIHVSSWAIVDEVQGR